MYSQIQIFHRIIDKIDSICSVPKANFNFIFLLKNYFQKFADLYPSYLTQFPKFFSRLVFRYQSTYRILVLVINDRTGV